MKNKSGRGEDRPSEKREKSTLDALTRTLLEEDKCCNNVTPAERIDVREQLCIELLVQHRSLQCIFAACRSYSAVLLLLLLLCSFALAGCTKAFVFLSSLAPDVKVRYSDPGKREETRLSSTSIAPGNGA